MSRFAPKLLAIVLVAISASLGGCVLLPTTTTPPSSEVDQEETEQRNRDTVACKGFKDDMAIYICATEADPPIADWISAYKTIAFALNDRAFEAGDGTEVQVSLVALASVVADLADEFTANGRHSTQQELAYRRAINAAGDACGVTYDF